MKTLTELTKKELREYGIPAAGVLLALCAAWQFLASEPAVLLQPRAEPSYLVIATGCLLGTLLGYTQFAGERARGTLAYLLHRKGGYDRLFRDKAGVGLALTLALAILPLLFFFAVRSFGDYAAAVQPARVFEHSVAGLAGCSAYAAGVLVALLSRGMLAGAFFGLVGSLGCMIFACSLPLPVWQLTPLATIVYVGVEIALALLLLAIARHLFVSAFDRDRVMSTRLQLACAVLAVPLVVQPAWSCAWSACGRAQLALFDEYPLLVGGGKQEFHLIAAAKWRRLGQAVDRSGDQAIPPERGFEILYPTPARELPSDWTALAAEARTPRGLSDPGRWEPVRVPASRISESRASTDARGRFVSTSSVHYSMLSHVFLDREEGVVRLFSVFGEAQDEAARGPRLVLEPRASVLRRGGASERFSSRTIVLSGEAGALFVDLADRTLWTLEADVDGARLTEVRLPQEDELVELRPLCDEPSAGLGRLVQSRADALLVGKAYSYHWSAQGVRSIDPSWLRELARAKELSGFEWRASDVTMTTLTAQVRKAGELVAYPDAHMGDVVFEHTYEPQTASQHALAALVHAGGFAAPPLTSALRLAGADGLPWSVGTNPAYSRVVADSGRFHAAHLLIGLALGVLAWRRTARRGGSLRERALWAAFAGGFGVFAYLFLLVLRPRPLPRARTEFDTARVLVASPKGSVS